MTEADEKTLRETVKNMLRFQEQLSEGIQRQTQALLDLDRRMKALERTQAFKPSIVDVSGKRVN